MDKKAKSDLLMSNVIYLVILIIFIVGMMAFVYSKTNSASVVEDYYAKEIVKMIDSAKPGDDIVIDVSSATQVAQKNKVSDFESIFHFDNMKNEVCVRLSLGRGSCFNYFNDVNVAITPNGNNKWIYYAETGESINRLHFSIIAKTGAVKNA